MKILDYFFYKIHKSVIFIAPEEYRPVEWRATALLSFILMFCSDSIICTIGIFFDNDICLFFKKYDPLSFMMIGFLIFMLLFARYKKMKNVLKIKTAYEAIYKNKRILFNTFFYLSLVIIFVYSFISYRLYILGRI